MAVGYRTKSARVIGFRRWASGVLKRYVVDGAAVNEHRIEQLGEVVRILARSNDEVLAGVAEVLSQYLPGLVLLRDYDEARGVIVRVASEFPDDALFGKERRDGLAGTVAAIYQGFEGQDLYPTVEEKAANLLYLIVKDHPGRRQQAQCGAAHQGH